MEINDWSSFILRGKVKEVREYKTRKKFFLFGPMVKDEKNCLVYRRFDKDGYLIESSFEGRVEKLSYKYNKLVRLDNPSQSYIFEYDEKGRIVSEKCDDYTTKYEYDESGKRVVVTKVNEIDNSKEVKELVYDDSERLLEEILYDDDGTVISIEKYEYDSYGNNVCIEQTYPKCPEDYSKTVCDYDVHGRMTQLIEYDYQGVEHMRATNKYNAKGDLREKDTLYIPYDPAMNSFSRCQKFEYEYDEKGNWIKKTVHDEDEKEDTVVFREIMYY